jgi:hypothetical protein
VFAGVSRSQTGASNDTVSSSNLDKTIYGVGANFSALSGIGVSARAHFAEPFSVMVTGFIWQSSGTSYYNYGVEFQYDVFVRKTSRFYLLAGTSSFYDQSTDPAQTEHLGAGFGLEQKPTSSNFFVNISVELINSQPSGKMIVFPAAGFDYYFW